MGEAGGRTSFEEVVVLRGRLLMVGRRCGEGSGDEEAYDWIDIDEDESESLEASSDLALLSPSSSSESEERVMCDVGGDTAFPSVPRLPEADSTTSTSMSACSVGPFSPLGAV